MSRIKIHKVQNNLLLLKTKDEAVLNLLKRNLVYTETIKLRGWAARQAAAKNLPLVQKETYELFLEDPRGYLIIRRGLLSRCLKLLDKYKYTWEIVEDVKDPVTLLPDFSLIKDVSWRLGQDTVVNLILNSDCGQINCPPGWGKSFVIATLCRLLPRNRIVVATKSQDVLLQRIYPSLVNMIPDCGIYCSKKKTEYRRVMAFTAQSLHHADTLNTDLVLYDEVQDASADSISQKLAAFTKAKMFAFSATPEMRTDNKDIYAEALFGPVIFEVPYTTAVQEKAVVDIKVRITKVTLKTKFPAHLKDTEKLRYCYWNNPERNELIASQARAIDPKTQQLILVNTVEHALYLSRLLPDFELIYSLKPDSYWEKFKKLNLLPPDFIPLTEERKRELQGRFERGELKRVIATNVWDTGVDMPQLEVIFRAGGGASRVKSVQIPGRGSRISFLPEKGNFKKFAVVYDYLDVFDFMALALSKKRIKEYENQGWAIEYSPSQ